jgi:hypothetical protein
MRFECWFASLGGSSVLCHRQTVNVTKFNTRAQARAQVNGGTLEEKETTLWNDVLF